MSSRAAARLDQLGYTSVHDYRPGKQDWLAAGLPSEGREANTARIGAEARRDVPTCGPEEPVASLRATVERSDLGACLVIDSERRVLGRVLPSHLRDAADDAVAEQIMRAPSTFRPNVGVDEMVEYIVRHKMRSAVVTDPDGRLIGVYVPTDAT